MNQYVSKFSVLTFFFLTGLSSFAAGFWDSDRVPKTLSRAHAAFASGQLEAMGTEVHKAVVETNNDPLVLDNAMSLLHKAYTVHEELPADWKLPAEVLKLKVRVRRVFRDVEEYGISIKARTTEEKLVKQLRLVRYPNQVILDKKLGMGSWEEYPATKDDDAAFQLKQKASVDPVIPGLYLLQLELNNGKYANGWFIIDSSMVPTTSPKLLSPAYEETFTTDQPMFKWLDYKSPQYQPHQQRGVSVSVSRTEAPDYDWVQQWDLWQKPAVSTQISVGSPDGVGVSSLANGRYVVSLTYSESQRFGDISLVRESVVHRPFFVKK